MWVKLTDAVIGNTVYVNLDRFDKMYEFDDEGSGTNLVSTISHTEEDYVELHVKETPEEIMKQAGEFK